MLNVIYVFPSMRTEAFPGGVLIAIEVQWLITIDPALGGETLDGATAGWMTRQMTVTVHTCPSLWQLNEAVAY